MTGVEWNRHLVPRDRFDHNLKAAFMFFSLDGPDGAGKTTQLHRFADWLSSQGHEVLTCRDPGDTWLGERLRQILLDPASGPICGRGEMLLYMAARAQLVEEVIRPALARGQTVVSDRYLLANVVYQGWAGGLDVDTLWEVGRVATGGLLPDLTIVLDVPLAAASQRLQRSLDRMEARGPEYQQRVRDGFLAEARRRPDQIAIVDATGSEDAVAARVQQAVTAYVVPGPTRGGLEPPLPP
jgi:dTMP kinase